MAVVVPDEEVFLPWAEKNGWKGTMEELCQNEVWPLMSAEDCLYNKLA